MGRNKVDIPKDASIEDLEKIKLREEIHNLRKPFWRDNSFLSIILTFFISSVGTGITFYEINAKRVGDLENDNKRLVKSEKNLIKEKEELIEDKAALIENNKMYEDFVDANSEAWDEVIDLPFPSNDRIAR